jgi:hypothetical protein
MEIQTTSSSTMKDHRTVGRVAQRVGTKCFYCGLQLEHPIFEFLPKTYLYKGMVSKKSISEKDPRYALFDHICPKSKGGKRVAKNGVLACNFCNSRRRDQDIKIFLAFVEAQLQDPNSEWRKREI